MTTAESERLDQVMRLVYEVREEMAGLSQKIDNLCELRAVNGAFTAARFDAFDSRCDERHGEIVRRVKALEQSDRQTYGLREKINGMGVPVAVLIAIVSVILSFLR